MISPHGDSCLCSNRDGNDGGSDGGAGSDGEGSDGECSDGAAGAGNAHILLLI